MAPNLEDSEKKIGIRFDGRVAIVTGAGAGLGRVYALELAKRGAKVVVNDLGGARDGSGSSSAPADKVVQEIISAGGQAVASYDSVATPEGGEAIVRTATETFGRVDILINNAGILRDKTLVKMEPHEWDAVVAVHLNAAYNVSRPAFLKMRENGYGRIMVTTSSAGLYGNFGQTNYSAAKLALVGFMNTLKLEGQKYNVHVNAIAPIAATRLTEDILPPDLLEKLKPEFVAPLVVYLCSEQCRATGAIYNAGMGCFSRAAVVTGPAVVVGSGMTPPTPEEIQGQWDAINRLDGAVESHSATEALGVMLAALGSKEKTAASPSITTVKSVFDRMPEVFLADNAAGLDVVFQYRITGSGGGEWFVSIQDGACTVSQGTHQKPTTTIIMTDEDFLALISRKLNAMQAFTSGKLKIEGDLIKSQLIEKLFKF